MPEYVNLPYICNLIMQTDITVIVNERCIIMDGYIWIQIKAPHWYMVCLTRTRKTFGLNTGPTSLYIWATFWEWTGEQRQERCVKSKTGSEGSASSWNAPNQPLSHYPTADRIMKSTLNWSSLVVSSRDLQRTPTFVQLANSWNSKGGILLTGLLCFQHGLASSGPCDISSEVFGTAVQLPECVHRPVSSELLYNTRTESGSEQV